MGRTMLVSIEVGLKDRASKGLQNIGGKVKDLSAGFTGSLGGGMFGGVAKGLDGLAGLITAVVPEIGIPIMLLNTGLKGAMVGVQWAGGLIGKVFSGIGGAISKAAEWGIGALEGLAEKAKTAAKWMLGIGLAAAAAAVMIAKSSLDAARELQVMQAQLLTAMKSSKAAGDMLAWAKKMAETAPFEVGDIVKGTTLLELFGLKAQKWLPMIADMAAAMRTPLDQAVQAVALAMSGGRMMGLRQYGISPQKLVAAGAVAGGGGEILRNTPEQVRKFGLALQKVMQESFGGGVARLFDTLTGKITSFKDAMFWLRAEIGGYLLPALKDVVAWGGEIVRWISSMGIAKSMGQFFASVAENVLAFGKAVFWVIQSVSSGKGIGETLKQIMPEGLADSIARAVASFQALGAAIVASFTGVVAGISADPATVTQAIVDRIAQAVDWLTNNVFAPGRIAGIAAWLGQVAAAAVAFAGLVVAGIMWGIAKLGGVDAIVQQIGAWFGWLVKWGEYLVGWIYTNLPNIIDMVVGVIGGLADSFLGVAGTFIGAGEIIRLAFLTVGEVVISIAQIVGTVFSGLTYIVLKFMDVITFSLIPGLGNAADAVAKDFKGIMGDIGSSWKNLGKEFSKADTFNEGFRKTRDFAKNIGSNVKPYTDKMRASGAANPYSPTAPGTAPAGFKTQDTTAVDVGFKAAVDNFGTKFAVVSPTAVGSQATGGGFPQQGAPVVNNYIDARGANATETQKAVDDAMRESERRMRWATAAG